MIVRMIQLSLLVNLVMVKPMTNVVYLFINQAQRIHTVMWVRLLTCCARLEVLGLVSSDLELLPGC